MSSGQVQLEDAKDEGKKQLSTIQSQLSLGAQLALQMAKLGPVLAFRVNARSMMALPWGLVAAGAAGTAAGVDGGDPTGVAAMTAIMVKMGLLNLVHDIVVKLGNLDRSDVTAAVTLGLLNLGEVSVIMQINNALIASGHMTEGAEISKEMLKNGQMQFLDVLTKAGGSWLGGDKEKDDSKKEQNSDQKGSSWFGQLSGTDAKPESSESQQGGQPSKAAGDSSTPGSSWFGSSSSPPNLESGKQQHDAGKDEKGAPSKQPSTVDSVADKVAASINSVAEAVMPVKPTEQGQSQLGKGHAQQNGGDKPQDDVETRTL